MNSRWTSLLILTVGSLAACSSGGSGEGAGDETADDGGPTCFEPFPWEILGGPEFRNVVSGAQRPSSYGSDETFTTVAYGQIDSDPSIIYDYAVGSKDRDTIYVYYGSDDTGLTVFKNVAPTLWDIGTGGVVDLALADLDDDGLNELIALTTNDNIVVWRGDDAAPWFTGTPTTIDATHLTVATGHSQMIVGDFNCDGHLDIVMPADDGAVIRYGDSMTILGGGSYHADMNNKTAFELAVDDLDGDAQPDIVASTDNNGEIYVLLGQCGNNPYPSYDAYDFDPGGIPSPNPHLTVVRMCGTTGTDPGIAIAAGEAVYVMCSDGNGEFTNVTEPHGEEDSSGLGIDYFWNADPEAVPLTKEISAVAAFANHPELVVLAGRNVVRLNRSVCGYNTGWAQALSQPLYGGTQTLFDLKLVPSSNPTDWRRIAIAGNLGLMILQ
jgi:hypothetical protein